jgi:F-type H+-transporting ATPase subunit alpha
MPLGPMPAVRAGDSVVATGMVAQAPVGPKLLGRIINALGQPLDEFGPSSKRAPIRCIVARLTRWRAQISQSH